MDKHVEVLAEKYGIAATPITPQMFASAGKEHMEKYGQTMHHSYDRRPFVLHRMYGVDSSQFHNTTIDKCPMRTHLSKKCYIMLGGRLLNPQFGYAVVY